MAYTLLGGVRVLEVALLAPDLLGMHLADLGAEVVKIEQPPGGDYLREIGGRRRAGLNLMHLRWNRGKKSVTLDLSGCSTASRRAPTCSSTASAPAPRRAARPTTRRSRP